MIYKKYRGVVFDLDGTLMDTIDDIAAAANRALRLSGLPEHSTDAYKIFVGDGVTNLIRRMTPDGCPEGVFEKVKADYLGYYEAHKADVTRPYDGVPELLALLAEKGIGTAVFSNKPHLSTLALLRAYFPGHHFTAAAGQREGVPVKPSALGLAPIFEAFGLDKGDILYVGDTATDMMTAKNAGLDAAGALWGFRGAAELTENGADYLCPAPLELAGLF